MVIDLTTERRWTNNIELSVMSPVVFRTVGYGHGKEVWNNIISTLKAVGHDGVISIEHEDGLMSAKEGLEKAVKFLQDTVIYESAGEMWCA